MLHPLILLVLGIVVVLWPGRWVFGSMTVRARRLREIEQGAPEAYFEERRDLTEYTPSQRFLLLWRIMGALTAIGATGVLIARAGVTG